MSKSMLTGTKGFDLSDYATFATCFLAGSVSGLGQVVYVNIDPDTILANDLDAFVLDMNNDGILDFGFWNFSYFTYDASSSFLLQRIWALPTDGNSIIGNSLTIASMIRVYPYALAEGYLISADKPFQSHYLQRMAFRNYDYEWNGTSTVIDFSNAGGYWYPEVLNNFLGVRFLDDESLIHYGWIRCDVLDEGRTLVVKDYAYESTPNIPIIAGDTTSYVGIQTQTALPKINLTVHPIPATDYINIDYTISNPSALNIYNSSGAIIYQNPHWTGEAIDVSNFPPAMYYLQLLQPEQLGYGCFVKE